MADSPRSNSNPVTRLIKFSSEIIEVVGKSFPHKDKLREMGCKWNPDKKTWYRGIQFSEDEKNIIDGLHLKLKETTKINELRFKVTNISDIVDGMGSLYCLGLVKNLESSRMFSKSNGESGNLQRFLLIDNTGYIQCIAWDNVGSQILKENSPIFIRNAYSKIREGKNELHCGTRSYINKLVEKEFSNEITSAIYNDWIYNTSGEIASLKEDEYQQFVGMVTEVFDIRDYLACPVCSSGMIEEELLCSKCNEEVIPRTRFILGIILEDNTNAIKATLFGNIVEELLNLSEEESELLKQLSVLDRIDSDLIAIKINHLIGSQILLEGKIRRNEYTDLLEMNVNRIIPGIIGGT